MKLAEGLAIIRDEDCEACKLHRTGQVICQMGSGSAKGRIMVVSRMPNSKTYQKDLEAELSEAGLDPSTIFFTSALRCRTFEQNGSTLDVKTCRQYLDREIQFLKPKWILTLGNEALLAATGHSGITKWRGRIQHMVAGEHRYSVYPTISLANVQRNPGFGPGLRADLALFASQASGRATEVVTPDYVVVDTKKKLKWLFDVLDRAKLVSYDVETTIHDRQEHDPNARIICLCGTCVMPDGEIVRWALPLYHPQSPWKDYWKSVLRQLNPHFSRVPKQIAHNGKFDARWLRKFGVRAKVTFDTMLGAHLMDENRQKGLKPQAMSRLGVPPWAIETSDLLKTALAEVLEYCLLDTWYTFLIYKQIRKEVLDRPRLANIYATILMPANERLIEAELLGIKVDRRSLASIHARMVHELADIDKVLMTWVPDEIPVLSKARRPKPTQVNFNPSNFARWLLFDHLKLPVVSRGKEKPDGSPGDPSMAEDVLLELEGVHPIVEVLLRRSGFQKNLSFLNSYDPLLDLDDRIHTSFKLTGTRTGRLSSGKEEGEKLTAARGKTKGINIQQVPRESAMRGLFTVPEDYFFVEVDLSQAELRAIAVVAPEPTLKRLYQTGQDVHRATASWVLGVPASRVSSDDRKKAKAVNFGFAYGMGAPKFVRTAFLNYGAVFTLEEAQAVRKQFFSQYSGLLPWHARQRRLVHKYAKVQSLIGRVRHLPDIRSEDEYVQGEAERQAINSPIQSFVSDLNTWASTRTMTAFERQGIDGRMLGLVHDAALFEIHRRHMKLALPLIKYTYEHLPLRKVFGVEIDVPIVADIKVGTHWGGTELTEDQINNWKEKYLAAA